MTDDPSDCIYPACPKDCKRPCTFQSFVRQIKHADNQPPDAVFSNIDDLLEWLNG